MFKVFFRRKFGDDSKFREEASTSRVRLFPLSQKSFFLSGFMEVQLSRCTKGIPHSRLRPQFPLQKAVVLRLEIWKRFAFHVCLLHLHIHDGGGDMKLFCNFDKFGNSCL